MKGNIIRSGKEDIDPKEREIEELYAEVERKQNKVPDYTKHIGILIIILAMWGISIFYPKLYIMFNPPNLFYILITSIGAIFSFMKRKHVFVLLIIALEVLSFLGIVGEALHSLILPGSCGCYEYTVPVLILYTPALFLSMFTVYLYFETKDIFED